MELLMFFIITFFTSLIAWFICFLLCDFKYLWCKKDCDKCGNWSCQFFAKKGDDHNAD